MQINILYRPTQAIAQCWLAAGESMTAESGAMLGTSTNVQMQTQAGGIAAGIKRMFSGESFFRNTFHAAGGPGEVLVAADLRGDLAVLDVGAQQWVISRRASVASSMGAEVEMGFGGVSGLISGAGLILLRTQGQGQIIVGSFGGMEAVQVNGSLIIDTGHIVAWQSHLQTQMEKSGSGWIASWLSGEGFVMRFQGQGVVWVQTRNLGEYGPSVGRLLPPRSN